MKNKKVGKYHHSNTGGGSFDHRRDESVFLSVGAKGEKRI
mgnify:CR=1 FL=1